MYKQIFHFTGESVRLYNEENKYNFEASGDEISSLDSMNGSWLMDSSDGSIHRRSKRAVRDADTFNRH